MLRQSVDYKVMSNCAGRLRRNYWAWRFDWLHMPTFKEFEYFGGIFAKVAKTVN
jgi:hypothetical protein